MLEKVSSSFQGIYLTAEPESAAACYSYSKMHI